MARHDYNREGIIRLFLVLLVVSICMPLFPAHVVAAPAVELAKTGQTSCWDTSGASIPCSATGQDGNTQTGVAWPDPRFTDNGNGTLTDHLTDLVWLKNADCPGIVTWQQALDRAPTLAAGVCGLADGSVAGAWRLPNRKELLSIMNFQQANGASWLTSLGFANGIHGWYWSSDSYAPLPAAKWVVHSVGAAWADNNPQITSPDFHAMYVRDPGVPVLRLSPDQAAFGEVEVNGSSLPLQLMLQNAGSVPLAITSITITGVDGARFSLDPGTGSGGTCGTLSPVLAVGRTCSVSLMFSPVAPGAQNASLTVVPQGGSPVSIALTGTGNRVIYRVTSSITGHNGTISPASSDVRRGESAIITLAPAEGYRTDTAVDGTCPSGSFAGTTYTTGSVTADCTAIFSFIPRLFTVSTVANGSGSITCNPAGATEYLTPVSCTVVPAEGEQITAITVDGIEQTISEPARYTHAFGPITADHTVVATFAVPPTPSFTVTPSSTGHGIITPQEPQTAPAGSTIGFTLTPANGYHLASVSGCGGRLEEDLFTTGTLTANCTITATFEPDTLADALKAFRFTLGLLRLTPLEQHHYDVAPIGTNGTPQPDGTIDVGDIVIMLRRLAGLIDW